MKLTLAKKQEEARGTYSFFWKPDKEVKYLPGQYFYFTLPKLAYPDDRGSTRHFTLSSSPTETETVRLTTRLREDSGYKKSLGDLPLESIIEGEGPNGTFTFDENEKAQHVFLAGGIGITPFRSMLKYAVDKKISAPIHLVYSNSIPEDIVFQTELISWTKVLPNFKLDLTISKPQESKTKWNGLTGRIDENLLTKVLTPNEVQNSIFWVCGPPVMVSAMEQVLGRLQLSVGRVRTEKFTGY